MMNLVTESEMEAAHQLIQLSDEDNSSSSDNNNNNITTGKRSRSWEDQEVDQGLKAITIAMKIQEPKKQRNYRSLMNIYMATSPISIDA
ncbi:uncharacterized protein LOC130732052 [Lotus japonicus]|uniref:uncharacterized protein LOC130732052 n=1 Tax=Lotus japonicus TaxID=34305 RepID=UPI002582DEF2|nr:uncharacterized protein LOC130732052 [Lotus japonicus]